MEVAHELTEYNVGEDVSVDTILEKGAKFFFPLFFFFLKEKVVLVH